MPSLDQGLQIAKNKQNQDKMIVDLISSGADVFSSLFGGSKTQSCGQKQRSIANELNRLPVSELQELARWHRSTFGSDAKPSGNSLARHYLGGGDCKVTSTEGKRFQQKVDNKLMKARERQKEKEKTSPEKRKRQTASPGGISTNMILIVVGLLGLGYYIIKG